MLYQQRNVPELQPNPFLEQDNDIADPYPSQGRPSMSHEQTPVPPLRSVNRSGELGVSEGRSLSAGQGQEAGKAGTGAPQGYRMREAEQERRFRQDQESRVRDYRRAFPYEPAPRPESYRSYEGSRPPRRF